jgi:hypothetical protein
MADEGAGWNEVTVYEAVEVAIPQPEKMDRPATPDPFISNKSNQAATMAVDVAAELSEGPRGNSG